VQVFVFGDYDSRGGTTAIAAPDRDRAFYAYAKATYLDELGLDEDAQRRLIEAEYLGCATLDGELPAGVEGVDLEWDLEGFARDTTHPVGARDDEDRPRWSCPEQTIELLFVASPEMRADETPIAPPGYWHPRWDDDAYGFVLLAK
jgi:hypothetical protein